MKVFGLSLLYDWGAAYASGQAAASPSAVAYAEADTVTANASPTLAGLGTGNAEAVETAQAFIAIATSANVPAEAAILSDIANRFWLSSGDNYGEAVDANTIGLYCAQQFCQTGGVESVGPVTIGPSSSGTLDTVSTATYASAKWFVTITDTVTGDTKVSEVPVAFTAGMPSFNQHSLTGDKISATVNVIYSGSDVQVIITNNGGNPIEARAARILTEV